MTVHDHLVREAERRRAEVAAAKAAATNARWGRVVARKNDKKAQPHIASLWAPVVAKLNSKNRVGSAETKGGQNG